jgi:hypothetical protein
MSKIVDLDYELLSNTLAKDLNDPEHRYNKELDNQGFSKIDLPTGFHDINLAMKIVKFWEKSSPGIVFRRRHNDIYVWEKTALEDAIWKEKALV